MTTPTYVGLSGIEAAYYPFPIPAASYRIAPPAAAVEGDMLLIGISQGNPFGRTTASEQLPVEFTPIGSTYFAGNPDGSHPFASAAPCIVRFGYRIATGSEPAYYTVGESTGDGIDFAARIVAYRGNGGPPDATGSQANYNNPQRAPSVTGTSDDALLVWMFAGRSVVFDPPTQPAGMTLDAGGGTANGNTAIAASETWAGMGGVATGVRDGSDPNDRSGAAMLVIVSGALTGWRVGSVAF